MFEGAYTALITPFNRDGSLDIEGLGARIEMQIAGGVDGIVPVGTTGESPTLSMDEHNRVIEAAVETAAGRVQVIAGTGGNSTEEALELTRHAKTAGADGSLQVTPYYNKPSQEGLYRHFSAVADVGLPVVLYNVPGRSAMPIGLDTVARLAQHPNIVSIKEAAGDVDRVSAIRGLCDLEILSGDDGLTLPMMVVGAVGVISVASNIVPGAVSDLVHHALAGRWQEARELHARYYRLFTDMFLDTNPIPVKAAAAMLAGTEPVYRLPLCPMNDEAHDRLRETLQSLELLP